MIVNLTPNPIKIFVEGGSTVSIAPSGRVARISTVSTTAAVKTVDAYEDHHDYSVEIPIFMNLYGLTTFEGLPDYNGRCDTFITSKQVAMAAARIGRLDVVSVGEPVKNDIGQVIGYRGFILHS